MPTATSASYSRSVGVTVSPSHHPPAISAKIRARKTTAAILVAGHFARSTIQTT